MKTITEKLGIVQQYRKVREYSAPKNSKQEQELDNQIAALRVKRNKIQTENYNNFRKETEEKILKFLNNQIQVLE